MATATITQAQLQSLRAVYKRHGSKKRPRGSTTTLFDIGGGKVLPFEAAHKELLLRHACKDDIACDARAVDGLPAAMQWEAYRLFVVLPRDMDTMHKEYWSEEDEDGDDGDVHVPPDFCHTQLGQIGEAILSDDTFTVGRKKVKGGVDMMVAVMKSIGYRGVYPAAAMIHKHRTYSDVDFSRDIKINALAPPLLHAIYKVVVLKERVVQRKKTMVSKMNHNKTLLNKKEEASKRIIEIRIEANAAAEAREKVRLQEDKEEMDAYAQWF